MWHWWRRAIGSLVGNVCCHVAWLIGREWRHRWVSRSGWAHGGSIIVLIVVVSIVLVAEVLRTLVIPRPSGVVEVVNNLLDVLGSVGIQLLILTKDNDRDVDCA